MTHLPPCSRVGRLLAACVLAAWTAHAQAQVDAPPATSSSPELSAEDRAALGAALNADAAQPQVATEQQAVPAPTAVRGSGVQSMNPDLSVIADIAAGWFSKRENLEGGGHDPRERGFNLQQLELSIGSAVDPYFRFDANIVFALDGVEVEEAYATTLDLPWHLQARAGQFLTRFGRTNATHPHTWDFVDQPFALTRVFGAEGNRGLGVELSWLTPLPWYVELVASTTQAGGAETARSFLSEDDLAVHGLADFEYVTALKQFFALGEDWSLAWGLSSAFGPNSSGRKGGSQLYGTDLYLKWRPITYQSAQQVSLQVEWFYRRRQQAESVVQDTEGFAALAWRFAQRWALAARYEYGSPALDTSFHTHMDDLDPDWTQPRSRVASSASFWPTEFSRLRLQTAVDVPGWKQTPVCAVFMALELVTGAHGAHAF